MHMCLKYKGFNTVDGNSLSIITSNRLKTHSDALHFLTKCSPSQRMAFLEHADNCICECVANVLKGHVKLRPLKEKKKKKTCSTEDKAAPCNE